MHPFQLVLRFVLEMSALVAFGVWGYAATGLPLGYLTMLAAPVAAATLWGVFAVSGDPSRGGAPVVETPGIIRLCLEFGFFASAALAFFFLERPTMACLFGFAVLAHYASTASRIRWLLRRRGDVSEDL